LKLMQGAVETNPGNFLLWLELGHCQQAVGLVGPAQISFTQARQLNPRSEAVGEALHGVRQVGLFARLRGRWRGLFKR
jgi:cytochrome c-type biogenesis protein CcmH/NrfG